MNSIELCRKLISIDSSSLHGTRDIAEYVAQLGVSWGLAVEMQDENYDGALCTNVILRLPNDSAEKNVLFLSHLDTDNPGEYANWVRNGANPFNASLDGDAIYGLGVADAKADFVCKLLALKNFSNKAFVQTSPIVVGTFGLSSGTGSIRLIRKKKIKFFAAVVGGATNMNIANKGPGYAKVEISIPFTAEEIEYNEKHNLAEGSISQNKIFNRSSDKSVRLDLLDNPIVKLLEYLKNLPEGVALISVDGGTSATAAPDSAYLEIDLVDLKIQNAKNKLLSVGESLKKLSAELKTVEDMDFSPRHSTLNIGMIRTYPGEIIVSGYCRLIPVAERDIYDKWLNLLRQECESFGATFRLLDYKPPFHSAENGNFFEIAKSTLRSSQNLEPAIVACQNCTEANVFSRLGIESLVFGPGASIEIDRQHASSEHVRIDCIEKATEFYTQLIERSCR